MEGKSNLKNVLMKFIKGSELLRFVHTSWVRKICTIQIKLGIASRLKEWKLNKSGVLKGCSLLKSASRRGRCYCPEHEMSKWCLIKDMSTQQIKWGKKYSLMKTLHWVEAKYSPPAAQSHVSETLCPIISQWNECSGWKYIAHTVSSFSSFGLCRSYRNICSKKLLKWFPSNWSSLVSKANEIWNSYDPWFCPFLVLLSFCCLGIYIWAP